MPPTPKAIGTKYENKHKSKGKLVPQSGAGWKQKGDWITPGGKFRVSLKATLAESFSLTKKDLKKAEADADQHKQLWCMKININGKEVIVLPADMLEEIEEAIWNL